MQNYGWKSLAENQRILLSSVESTFDSYHAVLLQSLQSGIYKDIVALLVIPMPEPLSSLQ